MMNDETIILRLPAYEPAGHDVGMSEQDLLQHLLVIGATGSGKTCLLQRVLQQLIARLKTGLLILDAKCDDTLDRVRRLANRHGRGADLVVLGPQGDHYLDLFGRLRSLADVDQTVRRLLAGTGSMGSENAFWDETRVAMMDAALTMLVLSDQPVNFGNATALMREWFFGPRKETPQVRKLLENMARSLGDTSVVEERKIFQTLDTISLWQDLDHRTRSNVQSTLLNALRPLLSVPAARCFESQGRRAFSVGEVATKGALCVVSVNSMVEPSLASLLFKLTKWDFIEAVQRRKDRGPLCGIVADELPLLVTADDVDTLATVRARRCFIAAATQGLAALDERIGWRRRKALLANFGTLIFLRSREEEVDLQASVYLGTRHESSIITTQVDEGTLISAPQMRVWRDVPVCPPGTLGRLSPHQGFIARPNQQSSAQPFWFVPWFEDPAEITSTALMDPSSTERLRDLLLQHGLREELDAETFVEAIALCSHESQRENILKDTIAFFQTRAVLVPAGLDRLPSPWLQALPGILWSARKSHWTHLPWMICEVAASKGALRLRFAQESLRRPGDDRVSACDRLRVKVNASLYPSCWRLLTLKHAKLLRTRWPDLKPASGPDVG